MIFQVIKCGEIQSFLVICLIIIISSVLKTGDPKGFQISNLCASARLNKGLPRGSPFVFEVKNKKEYSNIVSFHLNKNSLIPTNRMSQCRADLYLPVVDKHLALTCIQRRASRSACWAAHG
ncbi:hypothetical protein DLR11_04450 [Salmonella enterica subsp. salamae]|nr:hypothetical protein [Salmonella enterica subsp. salamae]